MPPWTSGRPAASAASFARNFVAKLSEPSTRTSAERASSRALASSNRRSSASSFTPGKRRASRRGLALPQVGLGEERLPVQVRGLDGVVVHEDEPAHAGARQREQGGAAEAA